MVREGTTEEESDLVTLMSYSSAVELSKQGEEGEGFLAQVTKVRQVM